ncbi:MAG TPA: DUF535 family protein [Gemmatimonadaceae bacterium]|nr:DUF535 family protein [Gemmatimonadaceae bacterium]
MHLSLVFGALLQTAHQGLSLRYQYYAHVAGILLDAGSYRALKRVLERPGLEPLVRARPDLARKYLWPCFARRFERRRRLEVMMSHYQIVADGTPRSFMGGLLERPRRLWEQHENGTRYAISLEYPPRRWDLEGELSLMFEMDGVPLYRLLLTLADGSAFDRPERRVLFVGAVQGNNGLFDSIREATRALGDVAPRTLLLAATAGLAGAFDVDAMLAVGNDRHITRHATPSEKFPFDYDQFWLEMGGMPSDGFFVLSIPLPEKPIGMVTATHRRRAIQRRVMRDAVSQQVRERMDAILRGG